MSLTLKPLKDQVIVITGASSGIGLATARAAAKAGARVVLAARNGEALRRIADQLRTAGRQAEAVVADVGEEADVERIARTAISTFGGFDTWVNDAGIGVISPVEEISTEDHKRLFQTNYWGVVFGSLVAARHFRATGKPGAIINLGSALSETPLLFSVAYSASKHAVKGFTDGLRLEIMHDKLPIAVTLIRPGGVNSRFFDHAKTKMGAMGKAPGPIYEPEVVAKAILHAAEHPRRDIAVGSIAAFTRPLVAAVPGLSQKLQASLPGKAVLDYAHRPKAESVTGPASEGVAHSRFGKGRSFSLATEMQIRPRLSGALLLGVAAAAFFLTSTARAR